MPGANIQAIHGLTVDLVGELIVYVWLEDAAGNATTNTATTTIYYDPSPPYIVARTPGPGATGVVADTPIIVQVTDLLAGVARSALRITVNGTDVTTSPHTSIVPAVPTSRDFTMTYTPPQRFAYGSTVTVVVDAADASEPPNAMTQASWTFTIQENAQPLTEACVDDDNQTGQEDGTPLYPFDTVQEAIAAAAAGGTVKVASGLYGENLVVTGKSVELKGGYVGGTYPGGGDFDEGMRDPDPFTNQTTISGGQAGSVLVLDGPATSDSLVSGLTLMLGKAGLGGGIVCDGASPTIEDVILGGNEATTSGGGMYCEVAAAPTVRRVRFQDNVAAYDGGGLWNNNGRPTLIDCEFLSNHADRAGGAVASHQASAATLWACTFSDNAAGLHGGAIYTNGSSLTVGSCQFTGNRASHGGAMANSSASPTVANCTLADNRAADDGGGLFNELSSSPSVANSILWGNSATNGGQIHNDDAASTPTLTHCDVQGGLPGGCIDGGGNRVSDPLFVAPGQWNGDEWTEGDYHLTASSPCVNAGSNSLVPAELTEDIDGEARIREGTVDIGADESPYTSSGPAEPGHLTIDMTVVSGGTLNPNAPAPKSLGILGIDPNGNPDTTVYAIQIGNDPGSGWLEFVNSGFPADRDDAFPTATAPEWHTAADWASKRIRGLEPDTSYTFHAKAKSPADEESSLVQVGVYATNGDCDVNRSGLTTALDYAYIKRDILNGFTIGGNQSWACDVNGDGLVNSSDLAAARFRILNP